MRPGQPNLSAERLVRIQKAVALKLRGKSYRAIGAELGVSVSVAFEDVWYHFAELETLATEQLEQVRKLELARLDAMHEKLSDIMDESEDDGTVIKAISSAEKLMERRAKLLGLDAPTKHQEVPADEVDKMTPEEKIAAHEKAAEDLRAELAAGKDGMH